MRFCERCFSFFLRFGLKLIETVVEPTQKIERNKLRIKCVIIDTEN